MINKAKNIINKAYKIFINFLKIRYKYSSNRKQSIVFVSFHKCATSFFSSKVLRSLKYHKHVDYLGKMYNNKHNCQPIINEYNFVYGVIRIQNKEHLRYDFVNNLFSHNNYNKTKQVYWIRDPRDILVSMYYSFGFTHSYSKNDTFRMQQQKTRHEIQKLTLDEYVLQQAHNVKVKFNMMINLINQSKDYKVFKYEYMILDFVNFYSALSGYLNLQDDFYDTFLNETRPNEIENQKNHKRSGKVGGYKFKLKADTIVQLNKILFIELDYFGYKI